MTKEVFVRCSCGCSVMCIKYEFGIVWFEIFEDSFYTAQTHILDVIRNRFDILKRYMLKKDKYFTEIMLKSAEFDEFVKNVNALNDAVKESIEDGDETSTLDSDIYIEYDKQTDDYILSVRSKYTLEDVLTGKIHRYYELSLTKNDFNAFTNRLNNFVKNKTSRYTTIK